MPRIASLGPAAARPRPFLKCFAHLRFLQGAVLDNDKQVPEENGEHSLGRRFIPMTRRTLCRKLLEDSNLYASSDHLKFQDLIVGIDTAISRGFHGILGDIKVQIVSQRCI